MRYLFSDKELRKGTGDESGSYFKFIENKTLSSGIYVLLAGQVDPQQPHTEDELYYVVEGRSMFQVNGKLFEVSVGDVIYVPAHDPHRFYDITEDLKLLVFFSRVEVDKG